MTCARVSNRICRKSTKLPFDGPHEYMRSCRAAKAFYDTEQGGELALTWVPVRQSCSSPQAPELLQQCINFCPYSQNHPPVAAQCPLEILLKERLAHHPNRPCSCLGCVGCIDPCELLLFAFCHILLLCREAGSPSLGQIPLSVYQRAAYKPQSCLQDTAWRNTKRCGEAQWDPNAFIFPK